MTSFFLSICLPVMVMNYTSTWTKFDDASLNRAKIGCLKYYSLNHCLVRFVKKEERNYYAICKRMK